MKTEGRVIEIKTGKDIEGADGGEATLTVKIASADGWAILRSRSVIPGWQAERLEGATFKLGSPIPITIDIQER